MMQIVLPGILKTFRRLHGLTQEAASERARVTPVTWSRWENARPRPPATPPPS